jgi:hypothetical protein
MNLDSRLLFMASILTQSFDNPFVFEVRDVSRAVAKLAQQLFAVFSQGWRAAFWRNGRL